MHIGHGSYGGAELYRVDMKNIKLLIEYDGTNYCGWQTQPNGISVQQCIEEALWAVTGQRVGITGAGRTDAGVHARGQVANFHMESDMLPGRFAPALNAHLPESIRIQSSEEVPQDFHARFSALKKTYSYHIRNSSVASPLSGRFEYQCYGELDIDKMKNVCALFEGEHDFAPFMAAGSNVKDTVRRIYSCEMAVDGPQIVFTVCGNGFLYKMVRNMVGLLLDVGRGKWSAEQAGKLIEAGGVRDGFTAPAKGLIMERVEYPDIQ